MSLEFYAAYLAACIVVVMAPWPSARLIIAPSMRHGARAGSILSAHRVRLAARIGGFLIGGGLWRAFPRTK